MKDLLGKKLQIGDFIVYPGSRTEPTEFRIGIISKFTPKSFKFIGVTAYNFKREFVAGKIDQVIVINDLMTEEQKMELKEKLQQ